MTEILELAKKTFSAKVCLQKILANLMAGSLTNRFERCHIFLDCSTNALFRIGWQCPKLDTAIPEAKSIYFLFFLSQTIDPFAFDGIKLAGLYVGIIYRLKSVRVTITGTIVI